MEREIKDILDLNAKRNAEMYAPFNPVTGEGSIGDRAELRIPDYELPVQRVPKAMLKEPLVKHILKAGGINAYVQDYYDEEDWASAHELVHKALIKIRSKHDFPFWAYAFVRTCAH